MTISGINSSTSSYTANAAAKADEQAASTTAKSVPSEPQRSTVVTLSDGSVSEVSTYSGKLSSMPMSVATAPEIFVQGDADHDNVLSLEEFTKQLKRVGVSSDAAAKLFDEINTSKSSGLSIDEFVKGVVATNAKGDSVFQDLYSLYTSDQSGKYRPEAFDSFIAQGATVARQYWAEHPELQQRS
jgi:Ca2+-binding EF-hand superfamily protein